MAGADLFGPRPRRSPRVMMHVIDAGEAGGVQIARFCCARCGHETDWLVVETITRGKRGAPCPDCNGGDDA